MLKHISRLMFCSALILACGNIFAQQQAVQPTAQATQEPSNAGRIIVVRVVGEVYVFDRGDTLRFTLKKGSIVMNGQMIVTGPNANLMLAFSNGATVTIGADSLVAVDEFTQKPFSEMFKIAASEKEPSSSVVRMNLVKGELISNVKKLNTAEGSSFEVTTPVGVAGIRGTTFKISFLYDSPSVGSTTSPATTSSAGFSLVMLEGTIEMKFPNRARPVIVPQGKQLVLDDITVDASSGAMLAMDDSTLAEPSSSPATAQAALHQAVQNMAASVGQLAMPATPGFGPSGNVVPNGGTAPEGEQPSDSESNKGNKTDGGNDGGGSPAASPAPQNPTPRLSPTDGTGPR